MSSSNPQASSAFCHLPGAHPPTLYCKIPLRHVSKAIFQTYIISAFFGWVPNQKVIHVKLGISNWCTSKQCNIKGTNWGWMGAMAASGTWGPQVLSRPRRSLPGKPMSPSFYPLGGCWASCICELLLLDPIWKICSYYSSLPPFLLLHSL